MTTDSSDSAFIPRLPFQCLLVWVFLWGIFVFFFLLSSFKVKVSFCL